MKNDAFLVLHILIAAGVRAVFKMDDDEVQLTDREELVAVAVCPPEPAGGSLRPGRRPPCKKISDKKIIDCPISILAASRYDFLLSIPVVFAGLHSNR